MCRLHNNGQSEKQIQLPQMLFSRHEPHSQSSGQLPCYPANWVVSLSHKAPYGGAQQLPEDRGTKNSYIYCHYNNGN
jgi:hypothetical protein